MELKPCPFCGGDGEYNWYEDDHWRVKHHYIECVDCCARGEYDANYDLVAKYWNRRHHETN